MITQSQLKELLHYNPDTGVFTHITNTSRRKIGDVAGWMQGNYLTVGIDYGQYSLHRLAFLYMIGRFPIVFADHKDQDTLNNRWSNLREADSIINSRNQSMHSCNTSGYSGVSICTRTKNWYVRVYIGGRRKRIGTFKKFEDAVNCKIEFERANNYHVNHGLTKRKCYE